MIFEPHTAGHREASYVNGATYLVDGGITAAYVTPELEPPLRSPA